MSRYIDADDLRHRVLYFADARNINGNHEQAKAYNHCLIMIDESKTADVVEVVRCDNCMWNYIHVTPKGKDYHICKLLNLAFDNDDKFFCAYGEKEKRDGEPIPHWRGQTDGCLPFQTEVKGGADMRGGGNDN